MRTFYSNRGGGFGLNLTLTPGIKVLLISNAAIFMFGGLVPQLALWFGLTPSLAVRGAVWQFFTYLFLHANGMHIVMNMLVLWMFGTVLEGTWGTKRFLQYYTICGVGAGVCVVLAAYIFGGAMERITPTVGASGAIYGLLMAFGIMYPNAPILVMFLFPIPAKYFVIIMGAISFYSAASGSGGNVSHIAHLGGLLVGYLYLRSSGFTQSGYTYGRRGSWFSLDTLRMHYNDWKRRQARRKFEVYMRERDRNDRVN